jgi:diphthine-ammonia ligase
MAPLQVIALVSGGKDSIYAMLHCLAQSHRVVALANLAPAAGGRDPDSAMYQAAGHAVLPALAAAAGLPLFRAAIAGSAAAAREYAPRRGDETEALLALLRRVRGAHPEADALCAGALASTYQRTRIESVAARLGLLPLAPLWAYPVLPGGAGAGLLGDMAAVGLEARIVKVASGGLDESFLWADVCDACVAARLERRLARFGAGALGEGGEFETLVLRARGVWARRVVVEEGGMRIERGEGGVAWLEFGEARVEDEDGEEVEEPGRWRERLRRPGLWDKRFEEVLVGMDGTPGIGLGEGRGPARGEEEAAWKPRQHIGRDARLLTVSNMAYRGPRALEGAGGRPDYYHSSSPRDGTGDVEGIRASLGQILESQGRSPSDIVFATILLRSMGDFASVNQAYGRLFTEPNPPARVTVACGDMMPEGVDVLLSVVVDLRPAPERTCLHVQSRSYWAPANIGPYSQAVSLGMGGGSRLTFVAGQIPLVPATMELLADEREGEEGVSGVPLPLFQRQAVLSLQHLWRIGAEMGVGWWCGAIAFVAGYDPQRGAMIAWQAWENVHRRPAPETEEEEDEDPSSGPDLWDKKYGSHRTYIEGPPQTLLPDFESVVDGLSSEPPPVPGFLAVQVAALPRESPIEWQGLGLTAAAPSKIRTGSRQSPHARVATCSVGPGCFAAVIEVPPGEEAPLEDIIAGSGMPEGGAHQTRHVTVYATRPSLHCGIAALVVPCKSIWGAGGRRLCMGLVIRSMQAA